MLKNKEVVIFDMDGTLIDSVGIWNEIDSLLINKITNSKNIYLENIQKMRDNFLSQCKTENIYLEYCDYLKRKYNSNLSAEQILELRSTISDDYTNNVIDYKPNAEKLIKILKENKYVLAIATTTTKRQIEAYKNRNKNIIQKADINYYFDVVLCKEDVKYKKPDPEIYNKIMKEFNVKPYQCLIVEDSLIGVKAARNAGIEVAVVYDKYSDEDRNEINNLSDYQFNDYNDLIKYIKLENDI